MNVSQYISKTIAQISGEYVFGISGIPNLFLYQYLQQELISIQNIHESHSIYSAMGAYLKTGKIHFSVVTAGPGITNCVTALAEAYISKIPLVVISVNNARYNYGTGEHHDSTKIGGIDTVSICDHVTVGSSLVLSSENIVYVFEKLILRAMKEKRPVHISIPKDILEHELPVNLKPQNLDIYNNIVINNSLGKIIPETVIKIIESSNMPLLINLQENIDVGVFEEYISKTGIPFANSMKNIDFFQQSPYCLGCFEYIQGKTVQTFFHKSDVIIILGDEVQSFFIGNPASWNGKKIIHVSSQPFSQCQLFREDYIFIQCNISAFLQDISQNTTKKIEEEILVKIHEKITNNYIKEYQDNLSYSTFMFLNDHIPQDSSIFVSVGGVNNFANVFLKTKNKTNVFMPSSFFNMGQSMKVIGYSVYNNKTPNFLLIGDGNFYMNNVDIITAVEQKLNINIIIFNNKGYASLIQYGTSDYAQQKYGNEFGKYKEAMDFKYYALSIGAKYVSAASTEEIPRIFTDIDIYSGVNVIEIKTQFDDNIPL